MDGMINSQEVDQMTKEDDLKLLFIEIKKEYVQKDYKHVDLFDKAFNLMKNDFLKFEYSFSPDQKVTYLTHSLKTSLYLIRLGFPFEFIFAELLHFPSDSLLDMSISKKMDRIIFQTFQGRFENLESDNFIIKRIIELRHLAESKYFPEKNVDEWRYLRLASVINKIEEPEPHILKSSKHAIQEYIQKKIDYIETVIAKNEPNFLKEKANFFFIRYNNAKLNLKDNKTYGIIQNELETQLDRNQSIVKKIKQDFERYTERIYVNYKIRKDDITRPNIHIKFDDVLPYDIFRVNNGFDTRHEIFPLFKINLLIEDKSIQDLPKHYFSYIDGLNNNYLTERISKESDYADTWEVVMKDLNANKKIYFLVVLDTLDNYNSKTYGNLSVFSDDNSKEFWIKVGNEKVCLDQRKKYTYHDIAFAINRNLGLSLRDCYIEEYGKLRYKQDIRSIFEFDKYNLDTTTLYFSKSTSTVEPLFSWFSYLENEKSIETLISYFTLLFGDGTRNSFKETIEDTINTDG